MRARWIVLSAALAVAGALAGMGTFASFSASTTNPDNLFAAGRIELTNTKSGRACVSGYNGIGSASPLANLDANGNAACDALISLPLARPGDSANGRVQLTNSGDYDGRLQLWVGACTSSAVATPAGSGNLCDKLEVYVQEYDSTYTTPVAACVFPVAGAACDPGWGAADDTITKLAAAAPATAPVAATPLTVAKGASRYFQLSVKFRDGGFDGTGTGADNAFQNRSASFAVTWRLQES